MSRVGRSVSRLVDVQVLRYKEQQRKVLAETARRSSAPPAAAWAQPASEPLIAAGLTTITVSREYGAAGGELAYLVAAQLGYSFFGQELVHEIARRAHVRRSLVETVDERCQDRIERWVADLLEGGSFQTDEYLTNLASVVRGIGKQGRAVVVGRAGHLLLEPQATLRVRVVGPIEERIRRVARRDRISLSDARHKVHRVDSERRAFYRQAFGVDINNASQFDLVVNTGSMSFSEASELIIAAHTRHFARDADSAGGSNPDSGVQWSVPELPVGVNRKAHVAR